MKILRPASVCSLLILVMGSACTERGIKNVGIRESESNTHVAAATPSPSPEWELVKKEEDGVEIYYSPKRINRRDDLSSVWIRVLNDKAKGGSDDPKDLVFLKEFNCSNKTSRVLSIAAYDERGKPVDYPVDKNAGQLTYVLPESMEESIMKDACK